MSLAAEKYLPLIQRFMSAEEVCLFVMNDPGSVEDFYLKAELHNRHDQVLVFIRIPQWHGTVRVVRSHYEQMRAKVGIRPTGAAQ